MEVNVVYNEDCFETFKRIDDKSIDMVMCDLPYGTTACKWDTIIPFEPLWREYKRIIKEHGAIVLTASQPFTSALVMSNIKMFKYELIWDKNYSGAPGLAKYRPMPAHENILVFGYGVTNYNPQMREGKPYIDIRKNAEQKMTGSNEHKLGYKIHKPVYNEGTRYPLSVIRAQRHNIQGQHPTQKPVALFEYLIKTYTNEGDLVLDNCAGSGTTFIAALNTKRNYIGCELDKTYYDIIIKRIQDNRARLC